MKFQFLTLLLLSSSIAASAQSFSWSNQIGSNNYDQAIDMAIDAQNNLYLTGTFADTLDTPNLSLSSNGQQDIFITKYTPEGNLVWASKIGSNGYDAVKNITVDAQNNSYLTGNTSDTLIIQTDSIKTQSTADSELFLAKVDANGSSQWLRRISTTGSGSITDLQTDPLGNSYVLGYFQDTLVFNTDSLVSAGQTDMFMAKYDANGNLLWKIQAGGTKSDLPWALALDADGNLYISGNFQGTTLFGSTILDSGSSYDNFVAKYDTNGGILWAKQLHSTSFIGSQIVAAPNGTIYLGGNFDNNTNFETDTLTTISGSDLVVAQYTADGTLNWVKTFGDANAYNILNKLATDANSNVYLNGWFVNTLSFGVHPLQAVGNEDAFVAKLSPDGIALWAISYGGSSYDEASALAIGNNGFCYTAGAITDTVVVNNETINSLGMLDAVLMQIDQSIVTSSPTPLMPKQTIFARPNPATTHLYINSQTNNCAYKLLDLSGKTVAQTSDNSLEVSTLARGMYLLQEWKGTNLLSIQKIILQ